MAEVEQKAAGLVVREARRVARTDISTEEALALLEEDQLAAAKAKPFGRRRIGLGTGLLLWGLRLYTVFMFVVVAVAVIETIR
jgi:hypothetical protein